MVHNKPDNSKGGKYEVTGVRRLWQNLYQCKTSTSQKWVLSSSAVGVHVVLKTLGMVITKPYEFICYVYPVPSTSMLYARCVIPYAQCAQRCS